MCDCDLVVDGSDSAGAAEGGSDANTPGLETRRLRGALEERLFGTPQAGRARTLGRHVLLSPLGSGGMGVVYLAYDPQLDRRVALKVVQPRLLGGTSGRGAERLLREAQAMAKLKHPNVVTVHDAGVTDEHVFIAMEFVEGGTLASWCEDNPPGSRGRFEQVFELLLQGACGLIAAHDEGLVHRDLKPANMLIGANARLRVADFGLARVRVEERSVGGCTTEISGEVSEDTDFAGTPAYMAPEQFSGHSDPASDQWSWCATAWEAVFGERAFQGEGSGALTEGTKPIRPHERTEVPHWFIQVLERGLSIRPSQRYPSMRALVEDAVRRRARRRTWALRAGTTAVAGIVGVAWMQQESSPVSPPSPCLGVATVANEVFNEEIRAELIDGAGERWGERARRDAEYPMTRLDDYVEAWTEGVEQVCRTIEREGRFDDQFAVVDQPDGAMRCYRDALTQLRFIVDEERKFPLPGRSVGPLSALPALARCPRFEGKAAPETDDGRELTRLLAEAAAGTLFLDRERRMGALRRAEAAVTPGTPAAQRAWLLYLQAMVYEPKSGNEEMARLARAALLEAEKADHAELQCRSWVKLSEALINQGKLGNVAFILQLAEVQGSKAVDASWLMGMVHKAWGNFFRADGDDLRALEAFDAALEAYRVSKGEDTIYVLETRKAKIAVLRALGRFDEAIREGEEVVALLEQVFGPSNPRLGLPLMYLAGVVEDSGDGERAVALFERAANVLAGRLDVPAHDRINAGFALAQGLRNARRFEEALAAARRTRDREGVSLDPENPLLVFLDAGVAGIALDAGSYTQAISLYEKVLRLYPAEKRTDKNNQHSFCINLAVSYARADRTPDALRQLETCNELAAAFEALSPTYAPELARYQGEVLQRAGKLGAARRRYVAAAEGFDKLGPTRVERAEVNVGIVEIDLLQGRTEGSAARLEIARTVLDKKLNPPLLQRLEAAERALESSTQVVATR